MAELNNDPRTQGVSGIKGLKGLTRDEIREELFKSVPTLKDEWGDSSKRFGKTSFENIVENYGYRGILEYNRAAQDNSFDSEYIAPEDFGHSTYDKEASTLADVEDLEDLRGRNQSGLLQLTNGAIKFGGTAASSFVDGTVGVLWGLGAAVAEGELSAFYNNAYAEASKDFRDGMEKWFPNYRETEERENYEKGEWYKNILTANFFGDHVMKTAGYTVGAVAAGSAAVKALSLAGRFVNPTVARVTATTLSSSSESALMANEAFNDNLKEGSKLLNTAASQELNNLTEGYLSIRSSLEAELKGLDDMDKADELAAALGEDKDAGAFKKDRDVRRGEILKALKELEKDYTERANNLKEQQAITEAEVYSRAKDAGDKVFLANMALLGVSEYFSVGRLYERLAKGKISSDAKSLIDIVQHRATVDKEIAKRAIKQAAYEPIQEGLIEEGGQSMIDETVKAAYLTDDVEAYRDALRNKESLKKGLDVIDAFGKGFSESYGNPAVWEEITLGGLMGMTGTVSVGKSNNSTNDTWLGKDKFIGMKGGAIGEIMAARRGLKEAETIAADVNKQLQNYVDPDGTIKRDIGVQAHFRDATEGWDRDTHKFGTLNKQANADFALVQTLYDIGQAKYLETLIDGVDIDQMTDQQLEETAKLLKITDSTGNNLKSDTKEGREEIKELLKRDRDDVKQAIKNFNTAYNVTEHLTRGISIDDDTKRELAYLNFKVLNFQDRSEAIREKYSKELLDLNSKLLDRYSNRVEEAQKDVVENKDLKNKKINNELALNSIISNMKNVQGNIRRLLQQQSKGVKKRQRIKNAKKNAAELEAYEKAKSILLEREKEIKSTIEEIESKGIKDLKTLEDTLNKLISLYSEVTRNYNYIYNLEGADSKESKVLTPEAISRVIDKFEDYIESIYTEGGLYEEGNKKSAKEFTKAVIDLSALNVAGNQFKERIQDFLEEDKRTKLEEKRREKEEKQRTKDFLKEMDKKDVSEITEDEIKELEKINNRKSKSILKKIESYNKKKAKQQAVQNKIDEDIKNSAQEEEDTTENTEGEEVEDAAHANMINYIEEFLKKDFSEKSIDDILAEASLASTFSAYTNYGGSRKRIADKLKSLTPLLYNKFKKIKENGDVIKMLSTYSFVINEEAIGQLQEYAPNLSIEEDYRNAQKDVLIQLKSYIKDYIEDLKKVEEEVEEEIENLPDNSESEEGEDSDASDDATPPVEPNEELTDSPEDSPSTDENTEGEGTSDNPDTNLPSSNEDSESKNTPPVNVNHVGPNQFPGWKPDVTEFWTHVDENGEYLPSDKAIEGKIKRTNREGKEYNLDYTKRQKIIFKTIYEFLKKKGAFEVVDKAIDSGEKLRFTVHYELVEEINKELKNNNEEELETYPIVIENADGMVLNVCGLDYTINNEGGINVTQTDIDAIKKEITEEAKKYKEENPEEEYYVSNFESEIASMMYGIYVPVNPKLSSLSKEEIKDLKVGVLQKVNEDGSYTLLVGDSSITVSPSSNYINTLGTPFVVKEIKPGKYKAVQLFLNNDTKTKIAEIANEMFKNGADLEAIKTFLGDIFDPIIYEVSTSSKSIIIKDATFSLKTQALSAVIPKELLVTSSLKELEGRNIGNILASFGEVNDINFSSKNTWFTFNIPYKKQNTKASTTTPEVVAGANNTVASLFAGAKDVSTPNEEVKDTFINAESTEEENNSASNTDNTEVNNNNDANTFIDEYGLGWLKEKNPDLFNNVDFKTVREVIGVFYFPEDMEENDWVNLLNNNKTNSEKYRTKEKEEYEKINIEKELAWFRKKFPNLSEDRIIKHVDNLIKIKGNKVAYGMYKRGIITLSELAATGTLYHESFHFVFDLFISNKEKEDIYKEAREKFNLKTQSDIEVEEQLAEAFRRYVQLEETPILGSLIHIFRELKHFIQNFIGNEPYINKLFYKINNAKIDTSKPQESSSQEMLSQYTQEMLDIKAKAIANGDIVLKKDGSFDYALAPNGKRSNLNERQWIHVRTKAFKKWFGDWTKITQNEDGTWNIPDDVSKVVDENGEPKEMYHGSLEEFSIFDTSKLGENTGQGYYTDHITGEKIDFDSSHAFFFTDNEVAAKSYRNLAVWQQNEFRKQVYWNLYSIFLQDPSNFIAYKDEKNKENQRNFIDNILSPTIGFDVRREANNINNNNSTLSKEQIEKYADLFRKMAIKLDKLPDARSISNQTEYLERAKSDLNFLIENKESFIKKRNIKRLEDKIIHIAGESAADSGISIEKEGSEYKVFGLHNSSIWETITENNFNDIISEWKRLIDVFEKNLSEEIKAGHYNQGNIYKVFLNIRNPIEHDYEDSPFPDKYKNTKYPTGYIAARQVKKALSQSNDGVIYYNVRDPFKMNSYGVFNSNQIKSATDNIGTYSEDNDDIRYREVEESDKSFESIKFLAKKDLDGILKQNAEKFWNTELLGNKKLSALVNNAKTIEDLEKVYKEIVENIKTKLLGSSVFISNNRARNEVAAAQNTYPREMQNIVRNLGIMYQEDASFYTDEELQAIVRPTAEMLTKERQKVSKEWIEAIKSLDPSEQFLVLHSITRYVTRENKEAIPIMYMKDAYENTIKKYKESKNPTSFNFYTEYNKSILEKITDPSSNEVISISAEEGGGISGTWVKFNRGSIGNAEVTKNKLAAASIGTNWCTQHAEQGGRRVIEEDDHDFYAFIPSGFTHATMAIVPIKENENELVLKSNPWYTGIFKLSNGANNEIDPQYKKAVETLQKKSKDAELQRTLSFLKIGTPAPSLEEIANRIENETLTQDDIVAINSSFNLGFSVINSNPLELTIDTLDIKRFLTQGERLNMNRLTLLKFLDKYLCEVESSLDINELTTEVNLSALKSIGILRIPYLSESSLYLNLPNLTRINYLHTSQICTINVKELSTIVSIEATDNFKINSDSNLYIEHCYFSPRSKNSFMRVPMNTRVEKLFLEADAEGDITIVGITKAMQIQISDIFSPEDHEITHSNHLIFNDLTDVHKLNIYYNPGSLARLNAKKLTNIDYIKSSGIVFNLPSVLSIKNVLGEFSGYTPSLMNINFSNLSITGDIMLSGYVNDTKLQNYIRKYPNANIVKADKFESAYTEEEAKVFTEVGVGDFKNRAILFQLKEAISKAGISVEIISESEIEDILYNNDEDLPFFKLPDGTIYGFVKEGVIYLVKDKMNPETLIHEYTHLWVNTLKQVNPELWENIKSLLFQTLKSEKDESVLQYAKGRRITVTNTALRTTDTILDPYEEMLAYYSGIYNERTIKEKTASDSTYGDTSKSFNSLKEALGKFWNWLKEFLTLNSNLNNITDVTNLILSDLLQGRKHVRSDKSSGFLSKIESEKRSRQLSTDNNKKSIAQDVRNSEGEKNLDINKQAVTEEESIKERIKIYEYRHSKLEYDNLSPTDLEYLKSIGMPKKAFNLLPVAVRENLLLCK